MILIASDNAKLVSRCNRALQKKYQLYFVNQKTSLLRSIGNIKPRVILLDVNLSRLRASRDLPNIQSLSPVTKVLLLSPSPTMKEGIAALKAGAKGYTNQNIKIAHLEKAIASLLRNELWAGRKLLAEFVAHVSADIQRKVSPSKRRGRLLVLTPRKRQVAMLVIDGATNKDIAHRLGITDAAVKAHLTGIFRKLNVSRRHDLARLFDVQPTGDPEKTPTGAPGA